MHHGDVCRLRDAAWSASCEISVVGGHAASPFVRALRLRLAGTSSPCSVQHAHAGPLSILRNENATLSRFVVLFDGANDHHARFDGGAPRRWSTWSPSESTERLLLRRAQWEAAVMTLRLSKAAVVAFATPAAAAPSTLCGPDGTVDVATLAHHNVTVLSGAADARDGAAPFDTSYFERCRGAAAPSDEAAAALADAIREVRRRPPCTPAEVDNRVAPTSRSTVAGAGVVSAVGDSWAALGGLLLKLAVAHLGLIVMRPIAMLGSTACSWPPRLLGVSRNRVLDGSKFVWLSMGGDDLLSETERELTTRHVGDCIAKSARALFRIVPGVRIVQFGYDLLCKGDTYAKNSVACAHRTGAACYHRPLTKMQRVLEANVTRGVRSANYSVLNLQGTFQRAAGEANAPNLDEFSPKRFLQTDCLHPSPLGWTALFERLADEYFLPQQLADVRRIAGLK